MRIGLIGWAGSGKDRVADVLLREGYSRHSLGDIIKRQLDPLLLEHMGISAFTENREEKEKIRPMLEYWSEFNGTNLREIYFRELADKDKIYTNRVVLIEEARRWCQAGGVLLWVHRPGVKPVSDWEKKNLTQVVWQGLISGVVFNDGALEGLPPKVLHALKELAWNSAAPAPDHILSLL